MKYEITSRAGVSYGTYEGESEEGAFRAMLADGGGEYGAPEVGTEDDWHIVPAPRFTATAGDRETSPELMEAILFAAGGNEDRAVKIWEDGPSDAELVAIVERVTKNGMHETTDFVWGAAGDHWATYF